MRQGTFFASAECNVRKLCGDWKEGQKTAETRGAPAHMGAPTTFARELGSCSFHGYGCQEYPAPRGALRGGGISTCVGVFGMNIGGGVKSVCQDKKLKNNG